MPTVNLDWPQPLVRVRARLLEFFQNNPSALRVDWVTIVLHERGEAGAAGEDRNVGAPGQFADPPGVVAGELQRDIAQHRGDAEQVELGRAQRQQNGQRVVDTEDPQNVA